jgi:alanyl-tRNA synthetase
LQETPTNYDTDLFLPIIEKLQSVSNVKYIPEAYFSDSFEQKEINRNFKVVVDHVKANIFAIADGAIPSNKDRGSVLRRLLRRSMISAQKLNLPQNFIEIVLDSVIDVMGDFHSYLKPLRNNILEVLERERKQFDQTLGKGNKLFQDSINNSTKLSSDIVFKLVDTYGFPFEIIKELAAEHKVDIDEEGFFIKLEEHRKTSRANLEVKGMATQATDLINFENESKFIYDKSYIKDSTVIAIFDEKLNKIESSTSLC